MNRNPQHSEFTTLNRPAHPRVVDTRSAALWGSTYPQVQQLEGLAVANTVGVSRPARGRIRPRLHYPTMGSGLMVRASGSKACATQVVTHSSDGGVSSCTP